MKLTKFVHSCVLVELDGQAALFDPGIMSEQALDDTIINRLDDIFITHEHPDHSSLPAIQRLVAQFPDVRITAPPPVVAQLSKANLPAGNIAPSSAVFFDSPHQEGEPLFGSIIQNGIHYRDVFTHPGDSHSFKETKKVLALPVNAPWGSTRDAARLGLLLKPRYILPIHDWHWHDEARRQTYARLEQLFGENGITFLKPETGIAIELPE